MPARKALLSGLFLAALAGPGPSIPATRAATTEQIVNDRNNGLAINGFDPVAYFIEGKAIPGEEAFELPFAGVVWRFHNESNRAAFVLDPEVYMPRFGGYDPVGVARGVAVPGDPRFWVMVGQRLYLFYGSEARSAFARDAERLIAAADGRWPQVRLTLSP
jgi:hypothetical protein